MVKLSRSCHGTNIDIIMAYHKQPRFLFQILSVYINTSPASPASPASLRQISVYKHFSGAGKVYINTSPAPERCFQILPRLLRRRRRVFKFFSGSGEVLLLRSLPVPGESWEVFKNTFPVPEKYLYTLFRCRTHFSGAGEVLIYTYLVPERPEKLEKYLYTPHSSWQWVPQIY